MRKSSWRSLQRIPPLHARVEALPASQLAAAHERLAARAVIGKLVVTL